MFTPSLSHPTSMAGLVSRRESYGPEANLALQDEMNQVIDTFRASDNGKSDLNPKADVVHLRSPKGRHETFYSASVRTESTPYRDREGYIDHYTTRTMTGASYRRVDYGSDGKPNREVVMSLVDSVGGNLISKTVTDKHGTSVAVGGTGRAYDVSYRPGDTLDTRL